MNKIDNKQLVKWIYFIPIASMIVIVTLIASILVYRENALYKKEIVLYKTKLINIEKDAIKDRINRLIKQIEANYDIINKESKDNIKSIVEFAYKIIEDIYKQNKNLPKQEILKKIHDRLKDIRFFDNLSGYFFIYDLNGTSVLLPIKPSLEGKNLLHLKNEMGVEVIKDTIDRLKKEDSFFKSWYWDKPGCKKMQKKIGYIKKFKPLNIFVGSAYYENDILNKVRKISLNIIRYYRYGKKGYIFAFDLNGTVLSHIKKSMIGKNIWNYTNMEHRYMTREMINEAKSHPDGFFNKYIALVDPVTKKPAYKISFVRLVPKINYVIGSGFYIKDIMNDANEKYSILKNEISMIIKDIILISLFVIVLLSILMIFVANKIKKIFLEYEDNITAQYKEINRQKKMFELLFEKSKDGIFLIKDNKFISCNEMAIEMFGAKDKEELLSYDVLSLSSKYQIDGESSKVKISKLLSEAKKRGVYRCEWLAKKITGELFWIEVVVTSIEIKEDAILHAACRDITIRKEIEKELKNKEMELSYHAKHDTLTNLPNRYMFDEIIKEEIARSKREDKIFAIVFMDLDGFKNINDYYGHNVGDKLLIQVAKRFKDEVRETDYLFRFGGDEFVLLLTNCHNENDVVMVVNKLKKAFSAPFVIQKHYLKIGVSMGVTLYPSDGNKSEKLIRNADIAMYKAKEEGKNRYVFYQNEMYKRIKKRHVIEESLKNAIKNDEFMLYYQPQVDIKKQKIVGFEALIRWKRGDKIVSPVEFIDIAEQLNLMSDIGEIVMNKAMSFAVMLQKKGFDIGRIAINLSDKQLKDIRLLDTIKTSLKSNGCSSDLIELEVTEGFVMKNIKTSKNLLKSFQDMGFMVSMDDFGTGYSSLAYLKKLPLNVIKIDQSFVRDIPGSKVDEAIVNTIIELGKGLNLKIIAEGVEDVKQREFLFERDCFVIQGYLYSKPIAEKDVIEFVKNFDKGAV